MLGRKDPSGFWTLFNTRDGTKVRMSFAPGEKLQEIERSESPELADVKITNFCSAGCRYSYQSSSKRGKHAPMERLEQVAEALGKLRCFEVALGGGEPTEHPQFMEVLGLFRKHRIIPSFSTRNVGWLARTPQVFDKVGGVAVSCSCVAEVNAVGQLSEDDDGRKVNARLSVQIVLGGPAMPHLREMLVAAEAFRLPVTLLAPKRTGRGTGYDWQPYAEWLNVVIDLVKLPNGKCPRIGIDTPLAAHSDAALRLAGIPHWLYETVEGRFSI
jgi:hypothetical protein